VTKKFLMAALIALLAGQAAYCAESLTPATFVAKASEAGMAEIEFGKLATQKGASPAVRAYGQRMVTDHGKADSELKPLAEKKGHPLTKVLNPAHQKALEELRTKTGVEFDKSYHQQMVTDHIEAVALFTAASTLPDPDLAAFASKTLPTLRVHQKDAAQLHTDR
jgi:putative membrane protein